MHLKKHATPDVTIQVKFETSFYLHQYLRTNRKTFSTMAKKAGVDERVAYSLPTCCLFSKSDTFSAGFWANEKHRTLHPVLSLLIYPIQTLDLGNWLTYCITR